MMKILSGKVWASASVSLTSLCLYSDYGYMRSDGFTGPCVRDDTIPLSHDTCSPRQVSYQETQGYRKVAGDVCVNGVESTLGPISRPCCSGTDNPGTCVVLI